MVWDEVHAVPPTCGLFRYLTLSTSYRNSKYIASTIETRSQKTNWWIDLVCLSKLDLNELGTEPVNEKRLGYVW